jgi:hypothetical protein
LLSKFKKELQCNPASPLLDIDPKEMKPVHGRDMCTLMFTALLFTIAKINIHEWMTEWRKCFIYA